MMNVYHFTQFESKTQLSVRDKLSFANAQSQSHFKLLYFQTSGEYVFEEQKLTNPGNLFFIDNNRRLCDLEQLKGSGWLVVFSMEFLIETISLQGYQSNKNLSLLSLLKFGDSKIQSLNIPSEQQIKWVTRLSSLEEELNSDQHYCSSAIRAIFKLLIIDLVRLVMKQSEKQLPYSDPLLNQVFDFIESHCLESISLADVAKYVGKSTSYLTNIVRQKTGKTVLQWIIEYRMAKARYLLVQTNLSVEEIAEAVGYLNMRHFSRQFGQIHGLSPRKWKSTQDQNLLSEEKINAQLEKIFSI